MPDLNPQEGNERSDQGLKPVQEMPEEAEVEQVPEFEKTHLPPGFNPKIVKLFLIVQFSANLFINLDMGILPACTVIMKEELKLDNTWFGFLGSVVYLGQVVGSAIASMVLGKTNPKIFLSICLFLNIATLFIFTFTDIYVILAICRMCTGLFQVSFCIYMPVWADAFGNEQEKSRWLTYQLISSPLGVILGYGLAAALQYNIGWRWAFYIQSFFLLPSMLGLLFTPPKYFDLEEADQSHKKRKKHPIDKKEIEDSSQRLNNPEEQGGDNE